MTTPAVGHLRIVGENETPKDICRCPVCDSPIPQHLVRWHFETRTLVRNGMAMSLPPLDAKIFNSLWKRLGKGHFVTRSQLTDEIYADRIDGGPESLNIVSVRLAVMRPYLRPFGISIKSKMGQDSGYWMVLS
jgi:predicted DNA-binding ribbon-helix-helix protein